MDDIKVTKNIYLKLLEYSLVSYSFTRSEKSTSISLWYYFEFITFNLFDLPSNLFLS